MNTQRSISLYEFAWFPPPGCLWQPKHVSPNFVEINMHFTVEIMCISDLLQTGSPFMPPSVQKVNFFVQLAELLSDCFKGQQNNGASEWSRTWHFRCSSIELEEDTNLLINAVYWLQSRLRDIALRVERARTRDHHLGGDWKYQHWKLGPVKTLAELV